MTYIINPKWFYWISILESVKTAIFVIAIFFGMATIAALIYACVMWSDNAEYGPDDEDYQRAMKVFKIAKKLAVILFILVIVGIFIPGKTTLIEMQVAKIATVENAEWTVESLKQAVDYIVESMQKLR